MLLKKTAAPGATPGDYHNKSGTIRCPGLADCLDLCARYQMLPHIRAHSLQVRAVTVTLGRHLQATGMPVNLPLAAAGALLHDIAKTATLGNGGNHAALGAAWLEELGYPEVADIVRGHVYLPDALLDHPGVCETQLVNYADKRVQHDRVVTLAARFDDLRVRYGRSAAIIDRITDNEVRSRRLEDKIFRALSLTPDDLLQLNTARRLA